ncbi:MAG: hypothetical protein JWL84_2037 [Rhodospirillales bacterium]|jgi:hypothetical protein|nr:hypothetical protein [Rhodospirillales bacterium]
MQLAERNTHAQITKQNSRTAILVADGIFDATLDIVLHEARRAGVDQTAVYRQIWLLFTEALTREDLDPSELGSEATRHATLIRAKMKAEKLVR